MKKIFRSIIIKLAMCTPLINTDWYQNLVESYFFDYEYVEDHTWMNELEDFESEDLL